MTAGNVMIFPRDTPPGVNIFEALHNTIAFSSADWAAARDLAWIYGIVLGWDGEECAMEELATKFRWPPERVALLRQLHAEFNRRAEEAGVQL